MKPDKSAKPYLVVNRALNKMPTIWILPLGMVYAIGTGFLFSFLFLVVLFEAPLSVVFIFWAWIAIVYYAVVGEHPWKFLNKIKRPPQWQRGNRPLTPLLRDVQTAARRANQTHR